MYLTSSIFPINYHNFNFNFYAFLALFKDKSSRDDEIHNCRDCFVLLAFLRGVSTKMYANFIVYTSVQASPQARRVYFSPSKASDEPFLRRRGMTEEDVLAQQKM